jgi:hypothetical protein
MKRKFKAGSTSISLPIFVRDTSSSTGAGLSGLTFGSAGLTAEYRRAGASSWTAVTLVTKTLGTYTSGGIVADGSLAGCYELDPPNAALAAGVPWVAIRLYGATNMAPVLIEIELDAVDYQDAAAFGLSRLDAAISSRSTYAGGDTSGTTTLLSRLTSTRAGLLDNLDAAVSTRSTLTAAGVWDALTTGLTTVGSVGKLLADNVNATISSRSTLTAANVWDALLTGITTAGSVGKLIKDNLDAAVSSRLAPTTAGRTLGVSADGSINIAPALQAQVDAIEDRVTEALPGTAPASVGGLPLLDANGRIAAQVGGMNANTLTASALAADAVAEIVAGVDAPTVAEIVAGVETATPDAAFFDNMPTGGTAYVPILGGLSLSPISPREDGTVAFFAAQETTIELTLTDEHGAVPVAGGATLTASLTNSAGTEVATPTVAVAYGDGGRVRVAVVAPSTAGNYRLTVKDTDAGTVWGPLRVIVERR